MHILHRSLIPKDFTYYRTGSKVFYEYYRDCTNIKTLLTWDNFEFIKAWRMFGNFYSIIAEKLDREPTHAFFRKQWIDHGIIFWSPRRRTEKPKWWISLPKWILKPLLHSSRSAFSVLDQSDYWNKWSPNARAHRRKVHTLITAGKLEIKSITDPYEYLEIYKKTKIKDPYKEYLIWWCERKFIHGTENMRIYMAYVDNMALAGAIFIDEGVTSEYFTSFYHEDSKPYHLGIALMDRWFLDSYQKWVKYCDLDHMVESKNPGGYTKFKESIADYETYFHDMWIKFF